MNLSILLDQLGEDAVHALSNGLCSAILEKKAELIEDLRYSSCNLEMITDAMEDLVYMRKLWEQYNELVKALDERAGSLDIDVTALDNTLGRG